MRITGKRISIVLVVLVAVAAISWLGLWRIGRDAEALDPVRRARAALAEPGLLGLAQIDAERLRSLEADRDGAQPAGAWTLSELARTVLEPLGAVDLIADDPALAAGMSHAVVAVSADTDPRRVAAVFFGRFDVSALEAALRERVNESIDAIDHDGARRLSFARIDQDTCRSARWELALTSDRIVMQSERPLEPLLLALSGGADPEPSGSWLARSSSPLLALELHPGDFIAHLDHPLTRALAADVLRDVERIELRAQSRGLVDGLELAIDLTLDSDAAAAALQQRWIAQRDLLRDVWKERLPALGAWHEAATLDASGAKLTASAPIEVQALTRLVVEASIAASAAPRGADTALRMATDAVEANPVRFAEQQTLASLGRYGEGRAQLEPVDHVSGPFGIRVERAGRSSSSAPLEVHLHGLGRSIPNLHEPAAGPRLYVDRVLDAAGRELRREQGCGDDRFDAGALFQSETLGSATHAHERIALGDDVALADVARIEGHVGFELPVRATRWVELEPHSGAVLREGDASVELTWVGERSFAYRARAQGPKLLAIRALNAERLPLAAHDAWEWSAGAEHDRIGARHHRSPISHIEVIFALEQQSVRLPFVLDSALPGTRGPAVHVESSLYIQYSQAQYEREFGRVYGSVWTLEGEPIADTSAGPFRVTLESLERGSRALALDAGARGSNNEDQTQIAPLLRVLAPDIPNLTYYATGLELALRAEPSGRDAAAQSIRWHSFVRPRHRFGKSHLEAEVELGPAAGMARQDLRRLEGELALRFPERVDTAALSGVEPGSSARSGDVAFTLREISRDRFTLHIEGPIERLFSARAFADTGEELACDPIDVPLDGAPTHDVDFRVQGRPARIEVQVVQGFSTLRYPLRIEVDSYEDAQTP